MKTESMLISRSQFFPEKPQIVNYTNSKRYKKNFFRIIDGHLFAANKETKSQRKKIAFELQKTAYVWNIAFWGNDNNRTTKLQLFWVHFEINLSIEIAEFSSFQTNEWGEVPWKHHRKILLNNFPKIIKTTVRKIYQ